MSDHDEQSEPWLTASQLAVALGLHKVNVHRFARTGRIPYIEVLRPQRRYRASDVRAALAAKEHA